MTAAFTASRTGRQPHRQRRRSLRRADGRSVYQRHGGVRYATHAQLTLEQRMLALARVGGAPRLHRAEAARLLGADLAQLDLLVGCAD
jgi:hypothetical protein